MQDKELNTLMNRILLGIGIIIVVCTISFFLFKNKWGVSTKWIKEIKEQEEVVFLVIDNNCSNCETIKKELKRLQVNYTLVNLNKNSEYELLLKELSLSNKEIIPPTIIYVKDQKVVSTLVNIKNEEELIGFIDNYQLKRE